MYTDEEYLYGELLSDKPLQYAYHIYEEEAYFFEWESCLYRHNKIYRKKVDKVSGNCESVELLLENNAKVLYDREHIDPSLIWA